MEISRRQFFRLGPTGSAKMVRADAQPEKPPIRPPGALMDEDDFRSKCERCRACSEACPHQVIFHLGPTAGKDEGLPFLNPAETPCRWCPDFDCIQACPTGALALPAEEEPTPIAQAEINLDRCLNRQGILCDTCATACPSHVRAIRMTNREPVLDAARCIGCGQCAAHCEALPTAIRIIPSARP